MSDDKNQVPPMNTRSAVPASVTIAWLGAYEEQYQAWLAKIEVNGPAWAATREYFVNFAISALDRDAG